MLIRPVAPRDLDALYQIAQESGPGFTSLMPDRDALARKIDHSVSSFARTVDRPGDEHYLFVLEDCDTGDILGTTGIEASAGSQHPLIHLHRQELSDSAGIRRVGRTPELLTRCQHYRGCTEICSLYLRPAFRRANAGKLLSRVRFVFMALHPERFSELVIAEMRGVWDPAGQSPFWNWLQSEARASKTGVDHEPLSTERMTDAARGALGEVHIDTRPARAMLEKEGFRHAGYVDPIDGGPTLECRREAIASVRNTRTGNVVILSNADESDGHRAASQGDAIITNTGVADFRATVTRQLHADAGRLAVPANLARALGLSANGRACYLPLTSRQWPAVGQAQISSEEVRYAY
ncbi:MAG: arginine N-succinyltransferase [Pseudomonadota bacterium]|nr:arginine N-succinyltransferase [Pseudomonadota bacterium]